MEIKRTARALVARLGFLSVARRIRAVATGDSRRLLHRLAEYGGKKGFTVRSVPSWPHASVSISCDRRDLRMSRRHLVYGIDVIDNFTWYHSAVRPIEKGGKDLVDYSRPRMHTLSTYDVNFYFTSFAEGGDTIRVYLENSGLKEGDTVIDLGAYCGAATWGFSKAVGPGGRVYALEPDRDNYRWLRKNIALHSLDNVVSINKGIWSKTTTLMFQSEGNMGSGFVDVLGRNSEETGTAVLSLDDLCEEFAIKHVDFIKMDIEGSEIEVLRSAAPFLRRWKPRLIIEPHYVSGSLGTETVFQLLRDADYDVDLIPQLDYSLPLVLSWPRS